MKFLFTISALLLFVSLGRSQSIMTFERIYQKIDTIAQNSEKSSKLKFTNTGNKPLIIAECKAVFPGDKCTFDKKAIAPGGVGYITYTPDSKDCGKWTRDVKVKSKDGDEVTLHLKGFTSCVKEE